MMHGSAPSAGAIASRFWDAFIAQISQCLSAISCQPALDFAVPLGNNRTRHTVRAGYGRTT